MDHSNAVAEAHSYPTEERAPAPQSGWDPKTVWRERVRDARSAALARRAGIRQIRATPAAPASSGWDPLATWRRIVRRQDPAAQ